MPRRGTARATEHSPSSREVISRATHTRKAETAHDAKTLHKLRVAFASIQYWCMPHNERDERNSPPYISHACQHSPTHRTPPTPISHQPPPRGGECPTPSLPRFMEMEGGVSLTLRPAALGTTPGGGGAPRFRSCDRARPYWGRTRRGRRPPTPSQSPGVGVGRTQRPISLRVGADARPGYHAPKNTKL